MTPYYPARDGYPSMFESGDHAGAAAGKQELHRSFVDRLLANQFPVPVRSLRSFNFIAPSSGLGQGARPMPSRLNWLSGGIS
jgi:hypothetical protein